MLSNRVCITRINHTENEYEIEICTTETKCLEMCKSNVQKMKVLGSDIMNSCLSLSTSFQKIEGILKLTDNHTTESINSLGEIEAKK